tara:strand:- start:146 stop:979 length:834 start_codon:yes stop_codon:yes gene_type:complete
MNSGYIKLHRKILDNPLVMKSSDHFAIWMYLLLNAAHKKYDTLIGSERLTLNPGQLVTGRKKIAKDLKINESKVQRILKLFQNCQQIEQQTNNLCRVISILKWDDYQQSNIQLNNERTLNKNTNNIKNIYIDQFNEFWNLYDKKVSKPKAITAYNRALKKVDHKTIMDALKKQKKLWVGKDKAYIKHPTTWLNQECWEDEIEHIQPAKEFIKPKFQKTPSGLYKAWCMKCGNKLLPNEYQIKGSSECCGVDMVPEKPIINNTKKQDEKIMGAIFNYE